MYYFPLLLQSELALIFVLARSILMDILSQARRRFLNIVESHGKRKTLVNNVVEDKSEV
jgi:hypothetical protein